MKRDMALTRGGSGWLAAMAIAGCLAGLGCEALDALFGPSVSDKTITIASYVEVRNRLAAGGSVAVIDVRPKPADYEAEHLPGALHIPLPTLHAHLPQRQVEILYVYSANGLDGLSLAAAKKLQTMGYENVRDFRGGLFEWKANKGEVETGPKK